MSAATEIVSMLGAYCPRVKITEPTLFEHQQMTAKRRRRPMIGRGDYGRNLMAYFDRKRFEKKQAKKGNYIVSVEAG